MNYYSSTSTNKNKDGVSARYQSRNDPYNSRQQLIATSRTMNVNTQKQTNILQQQQIADLERKIDIILMHNQKLQSQKQRYRLMVEELTNQNNDRAMQSNTARFVAEQNQVLVSKLRKQLQISAKQYESKLNQAYESRQILKKQIQTLSRIIEELNEQNRTLKLQIKEHTIKQQSLTFKLKQQFIRQQAELQNRLRDEFLMKEIQYKNEKQQLRDTYEKQISQLLQQFKQQKRQIQQNHNDFINIIHEENHKDKENLKQILHQQFQQEKQQLEQMKKEQLRRQKQNAIEFIKKNLENVYSNDQQIKKQYQEEIETLKQSLQSRKKLIDRLLSSQKPSKNANIRDSQRRPSNIQGSSQNYRQNQDQSQGTAHIYYHQYEKEENNWFQQLLALKEQLKNVTNSFLRESELLKLKLTEKHEIDIKELKKIYQNKIQLMSIHIERVQSQNVRLRDMYQNALNQKHQLKKDFQLERSKLKNLIRKLKVELHGIQEQFRINIQGVRDQTNTFSMTMMKSVMQVKQKANFYAQQNRKLRKAYQQHQKQLVDANKIAQQKVQYYQSKYQSLKERINSIVQDYKQKIQVLQVQSEERQNNLRQNLNKQHEMIQSLVQEIRRENTQLTQQNEHLKKKNHQLEYKFKEKDDDIAYYRSKVDQLEADIERLKMDLEMAGINDKDTADTINQWKNHYETIINQLQQEKTILNQKIIQKDSQLVEIVRKYKSLQFQLQKAVKTLKKRSTVQRKVVELGMDANLVKNLAQVFCRETQSKQTGYERESYQQ